MHDARTKLGAGRRARGPRALPAARLRHRDPAQRPARRGAELRPPGDPSRSALRRLGGLLRAGQGGGRTWLSASRGMGRGLAAILLDAEHDGRGRRGPRAAPAPGRADRAQPAPAAARLRRGGAASRWPSRCASAACCSRCSCARSPGGTLRADRRRAPLARRAARRARDASRRSCAPHDDAESLELALIENMAREDLNPVEEARACALLVEELGLTREEVGRRVGRSRVAVSNLLRLLDLPDEVLELLAGGDADRGPRPRAADGAATTTTAAGSPAPRPPRAGRSARPRREARAPAAGAATAAPPRRAAAGPPRPVEAAARASARRFGRALGADVKVTRRGAPATRSRWPSTRSTRRSSWPALGAHRRPPEPV